MTTIILADKTTRQSDFFDENGKVKNLGRVTRPLICTCAKELGGMFELYAEFVNPTEGTADYLTCGNYMIAPILGKWDDSGKATRKQQIFFIKSAERDTDENGVVYVRIYADHITYKLRNRQMLKADWDSKYAEQNFTCKTALALFAASGAWDFAVGDTDISIAKKIPFDATATYASAILDETGVIRSFGAELHRDNFYISGRRQKEFCRGTATNPAFRLICGKEVSGVNESIDFANTVTTLKIPLTTGFVRSLIVKPQKIGMTESVEGYYESAAETDTERIAEAKTYFETVNHPQLSYTLRMNQLKKTQLYAAFSQLAACDIGDVGIVESAALGLSTAQKVTQTVEDVLAGEYTEIALGNIRGSIARAVNNTMVIGAEAASLDPSECAGFTAEITVRSEKNSILLRADDVEDYDAYVDCGDLYTTFMSEQADKTLLHKYAYEGTYTLQYNAFGGAQTNALTGIAMIGVAGSTSAAVDNIIFNASTEIIGTWVTAADNGYIKYAPLFSGCASITVITITDNVRYISPYAFYNCTGLTDINYSGSIAEWQAVQATSDPDGVGWQGTYDVTVHCSNGDTTQPGTLGERS